jgi:polysaccharide biosynthesis transport protein
MSYQHFPFDNQPAPRPTGKAPDDFVDLERILHMAMRQAKVVLVAALAGLLLGVVYLQTTPSTYTSSARVLIDEELSKIVDEV